MHLMQCIIHNSIRTLATDLFLLFIQKLNEADVMTVFIKSSLFGWLHVLDQYNTLSLRRSLRYVSVCDVVRCLSPWPIVHAPTRHSTFHVCYVIICKL